MTRRSAPSAAPRALSPAQQQHLEARTPPSQMAPPVLRPTPSDSTFPSTPEPLYPTVNPADANKAVPGATVAPSPNPPSGIAQPDRGTLFDTPTFGPDAPFEKPKADPWGGPAPKPPTITGGM